MVPASYRPRKKFMELAVSEAKRAGDRGDYPIGAVITRLTGGREEDIAADGCKSGTDDFKWRACLIPCRVVFEKGNHSIPVTGGFLRKECQKLFSYRIELR